MMPRECLECDNKQQLGSFLYKTKYFCISVFFSRPQPQNRWSKRQLIHYTIYTCAFFKFPHHEHPLTVFAGIG